MKPTENSGDDPGPGAPTLQRAISTVSTVRLVTVAPTFLLGALALQMRADLDFSQAKLGIAAASLRGVVALTSTTLGRVVDLAGPSRTMRIGALVTAFAALGIALFANSWEALVGWLVLGGVASALSGPATNAFIARAVRAGRRGLAFGFQQSAPPGAALVGGFALPLVALTVGWRWVFGGLAVAAILATLLVPSVASSERRPRDERRPPLGLRTPAVVAAAMGFGFGAATTMSTFLVEAAVEAGIDEGAAGVLLALGALSSIAARLITGRLVDEWDNGHLLVAATMLAGGVGGYFLLATGEPIAVVIGTILVFGLGWGFSAITFFAIGRMHPDHPGAAAGVVFTGASLGGIVTPVIFGYVLEAASFGAAWMLLALWPAVGAVLLLMARRMHNRDLAIGDPKTV